MFWSKTYKGDFTKSSAFIKGYLTLLCRLYEQGQKGEKGHFDLRLEFK